MRGHSYRADVREFASSSISLAGSLLIAHPNLLDPHFRKSVLFISTNDAQDGSFGLTLNRPAGRSVAEILPDKELGPLGRVPVFLGGPVATDQLVFASFHWHAETDRLECTHHLVIDEAKELAHDESLVLRAFVGYAGWSKGQLEAELAQRSWLVGKALREVLDLEHCPTLWRDLARSYGPWFQLLAEAPDTPELN